MGDGAVVTAFQPHRELRDRVAGIDVVEHDAVEHTVLPSAGAVLGLQLRGRVRAGDEMLSIAGVTGIQPGARRYGYVGDTASILVRFTPQGASCLGVPASELAGRSVALDELIPPARARELCERVGEAPGVREGVGLVEELLLGLPFVQDRVIARAMERLEAGVGEDAGVAGVAREVGLCERQLERRFLARVGITPKRFATLRRFERAVALARTTASLTSVALQAGYYDQSHFIREFRRFTGAAPRELLGGPRR